jgi:hypothetical protein
VGFLVAVDDSLHIIRDALQKRGYETVELSVADFRDVDAYVVDSSNKDLVKRKNTIADERVIAAGNDDAETVLGILEKSVRPF